MAIGFTSCSQLLQWHFRGLVMHAVLGEGSYVRVRASYLGDGYLLW